jgi:hypothetical protein
MKRWMGASAIALVTSFLLSLGVVGAAGAQQYPPPTPTEKPEKTPKPTKKPKKTKEPKDSCLVVEGENDGTFTAGTAEFRSNISVEGASGCAEAFGEISATVFSDPVRMETFTALEDGSFQGVFCLPAVVESGDHEVEVSIEGRGVLTRDLRVLEGDGQTCGPGDGTVVAGISQANTGSGDALPRTGAGVLILVMWALVLVGLGTVLVASAWRYRARLVPLRAFRTNRRLGNADPPVPFVDTSRFTPYRSRVARGDRAARRDARGKSEPPTEWDAAHRSERPPN